MNRYGLIGYPLSHSLSPQIHEKLFALTGISGTYELFEIPPENLKQSKPELLKFAGFNVTIPHKETILPLLDSFSEQGAVNTVLGKKGKLHGFNTDILGFAEALALYGMQVRGKSFCLYGAGGAARAAAYEIAMGGGKLTIAARDTEKAKQMAEDIQAATLDIECAKQWPFCTKKAKSEIESKLPAIDIIAPETPGTFDTIVNATPVGMSSHSPDSCVVPDSVIEKCANVFDMVYNPRETLLIKKAKAYGKNARNGMAMLVFQAAYAQIIWKTGEILPMDEVFRTDAVFDIIQKMEKENG
jgi:shikimate dehydrogenase